jgi:hypothetical protein
VAVDSADPHARAPRDVVHLSVDAAIGEHLPGGLEDPLMVATRVSP